MSALDAARSPANAGLAGAALPASASLWTVVRRMWVAVTTRNQLAELDDRMLHDLGLSRADVVREVARAPWDTAPVRRGDREL
ncbi:DUF1127 domain-containing protein [Elioraea rosea]|uniref:DUF1127 domain-containing protein n=1 Tax=Elioraea rosea TaxID=2492390 RepID=UPI00131568E7|nr:DUF1127 domain-containing protein [Elioraea rosea]